MDGKAVEPAEELDLIFPVLHGTFGEDGTLQGLLEMADIAYVGAGVLASSVAMDKGLFKRVMQSHHIPVLDWVVVQSDQIDDDMDEAIRLAEEVAGYPLFVKPANMGSSVGVSKVSSRSDLMEGLMEARQFDRRVIVEHGIEAREIEVSVMGNDKPLSSVCGEIIPGEEFYSYEAKYHDESSQTLIPADIPDETAEQVRELAVKAYKACDLAGLARVDFFIDKDTGKVFLNELNTIPGFTQISMYPMLWEASGISYRELITKLVELAIERHVATRVETQRPPVEGGGGV